MKYVIKKLEYITIKDNAKLRFDVCKSIISYYKCPGRTSKYWYFSNYY